MGAEFIDYIIADETVVPFEHQPYYTEKIIHLPDCYQVNDTKRKIAERMPRQEVELPEEGCVFCCFNNNWKITPECSASGCDCCMQSKAACCGCWATTRVQSGTCARKRRHAGLTRLVWCSPADCRSRITWRATVSPTYLDTLPYNAHTTASDALWTGLPVVTLLGEAFAGRVAASLLNAIGLPELVTHSIEDYEALALRLAKDPSLLEGYRNRLATNRLTHPLFDTDRFRRHIEAAYQKCGRFGSGASSREALQC